MTQYLLSVHHVEGEPMPEGEAAQAMFEAVDAFNDKVRAEGAWVFAGGLEDIAATTTVDASKGEAIVTDGPFAESKEWMGGFWVIEAPDLDAALKWATEGSAACGGPVQVRPFQAA